ncbi:MAG: hypothetical protein ACO3UW_13000 [Candidatus Nanopelagicales bacterium]
MAKSDQLNADDLVGGPITVQITGASQGEADQPLILTISGGHRPWKPCKTARRVLAACVGSTRTRDLIGRWVRLYRDPDVTWAGKAVGGIRVDAISGIDRPVTIALAASKKAKVEHRISPLKPPATDTPTPPADPMADLTALLSEHGLTVADLDRQAESSGKPSPSTMDPARLARVLAYLRTDAGGAMLRELAATE